MARILIIDDEEAVLELLKRLFELEGYEVVLAKDGKIGERLFRQQPADLVITDIFMPEQEGIETIMDLRRDFPYVKIIAISGGGSAMTYGSFLKIAELQGAQRTFSKPLDIKELLQAVRELLS
jgi:DNA-binding response OmpR family regulator